MSLRCVRNCQFVVSIQACRFIPCEFSLTFDNVFLWFVGFPLIFPGSSVPSAFVLFVMRELPPPPMINRQEESTTIAFISDGSVAAHPRCWTTATSVQNQVLILLTLLFSPLQLYTLLSHTHACRCIHNQWLVWVLKIEIILEIFLKYRPLYLKI